MALNLGSYGVATVNLGAQTVGKIYLGVDIVLGGGGGGDYVAKAVHIDGATYLDIAGLAAVDNGLFSCAMWIKISSASHGSSLWQVDANGNFTSSLGNGSAPATFYTSLKLFDATNSGQLNLDSGPGTEDVFHSVIISANTNLAAGSKQVKIYVDGVDMTTNISDTDPAFLMAFNGKEFSAFSDGAGDGWFGDVADYWIAPGQSLLTDGDIAPATLAKFRDPITGKPVDLGADGSTPTGLAPAIFFSGDETEFATNKGTGGAFTLTGTLTNATTSPSD
jgi:hypothetical protein